MKTVHSELAGPLDFDTWMKRQGQPAPTPAPTASRWVQGHERIGDCIKYDDGAGNTVAVFRMQMKQTPYLGSPTSDYWLWGYRTPRTGVVDEHGNSSNMSGLNMIQPDRSQPEAWLKRIGAPLPTDADWKYVGL